MNDGMDEFSRIARGFCAWCEASSPSEDGPHVAASIWLASLHAAALTLPNVASANGGNWPEIPATERQAAETHLAGFRSIFYREYFDPDPGVENEGGEMGDVHDDLMDTYEDVKRGLLAFDRRQIDESLWHWSFLHRIHWGRHAVGAMFALHCLRTSKPES